MTRFIEKHLVVVRHGESEGDVRRASRNQPQKQELAKHPHDEEQTRLGHEQSVLSGKWIARYVLTAYGANKFDWQLTSPLIRTRQSAQSLGLQGHWSEDSRLAERDRGAIQGMTKQQHENRYPESYRQMQEVPFHWKPPEGESLIAVSHRFSELVQEFMRTDISTAILMTHRDVMWAAHAALDKKSLDEIETIDTSIIRNGHVFHYTNVNPHNKQTGTKVLAWKRTITPWSDDADSQTATWENIIEH